MKKIYFLLHLLYFDENCLFLILYFFIAFIIYYEEREVLLFLIINVISLYYNGASYSNSLFNFIVSNARIFCD